MRIITVHAGVTGDAAERLAAVPKETRKGLKDVLNEMAKDSKEELYQEVKRQYTLKRGRFQKGDIRVKKATQSRLEAVLMIEGGPESIKESYRFKMNSIRKGVRVEIKRGSGFKELKKREGDLKAFVTGVTTGHRDKLHVDVFQREGKSRLPIKKISGPGSAKISEVLWRKAELRKEQELKRRIRMMAERILP